ncbi:LPS-assembly protein LptD [Kordiimonas aestuarii]|uniref:LPS-assembly protein LptD n=1 Tax=Kordiimonas aestuarii TaxID=1005925 RepID=UPI0021CF443C|nr:LPS assembly protein LptD [Kordiimonas aestuarii]
MRKTVSGKSLILAGLLASTVIFAPPINAQEADEASANVELSADSLTYNPDTGEVRAIGRVYFQRDGYVLEAGEVVYNERTGTAEAFGAVELTTPTGERILAPKVILSDALRDAFVEDIRLLMTDGAQVAAAEATRDGEAGTTTLDHAVYSPCKVCADGSGKEPLWQIKAVRVVHDREKKRLYYKNASLEVFGVPILWTPYFSHPDPTVDRASGLLPLDIQTGKNLGVVIGVPYYHVFNDSQDATLKPIFTTKEGLVLAGEYRHHLGFGRYEMDGSVTYTDGRDDNGDLTGEKEFRGHFSSDGYFSHSKRWRSTYQVNWASDDTYLRRYDLSDADTLVSEYNLEGFYDRSYISVRTVGFQGLRVEDVSGLTGHALPLIDAEYIPNFQPLGGSVSIKGNALALRRTDGLDTQRVSLSASWQRRLITPKGFVVDLEAYARSEAYNLSDTDRPDDPIFSGTFGAGDGSEWRNLVRATATVTWPLVKFTDSGSHTVEPIVEVTVSPRRGTPDDIVNEDSRAFELNDLNLFSADRASGYDLWEEGSRVTYGMQWRYDGPSWSTDVMLGQSWRITGTDTVFADGAGLEGDLSNLVGRTRVTYKNWLDFEHRYRVDEETLAVRRNELMVAMRGRVVGMQAGYLKLDRDMNIVTREDREEVRASAYYNIDENWRVDGGFTHRLSGASVRTLDNSSGGTLLVKEDAGGVKYDVGVSYSNECIELGLRWRETYTRDRDVEPGTSIMFRLKLKNLG